MEETLDLRVADPLSVPRASFIIISQGHPLSDHSRADVDLPCRIVSVIHNNRIIRKSSRYAWYKRVERNFWCVDACHCCSQRLWWSGNALGCEVFMDLPAKSLFVWDTCSDVATRWRTRLLLISFELVPTGKDWCQWTSATFRSLLM